MSEPAVLAHADAGVLLLRLNRPTKRNAMNRAMAFELREHLDLGPDVQCVVITGDDRAFSAGADLGEGADADAAGGNGWYATLDRLAALRVPTIAAIEGFCLGGGLELAMCCDIRIASEGARLGTPEMTHGHWPGGGGTQRLPRLVGEARAKHLILTARPIDAATALVWGLVTEVVGNGQASAVALDHARELATRPRRSVEAVKDLTELACEGSLSDGLRAERARWLAFAEATAADAMQSEIDRSRSGVGDTAVADNG